MCRLIWMRFCISTGQHTQYWNRNCLALGLPGGFVEPDVQVFNTQMKDEFYFISDFIVMHYHLTDTEFWWHCKAVEIPDSLQRRLDLFKKNRTYIPASRRCLC